MNSYSNPKISIIIPVYGVERYIRQCVESVLLQTLTDYECLLIDDGSLDNSIEIAKSIVKDDKRFLFLQKENGGQGSARNMGLDQASGDYIAFIDSDDYVAPFFLEEMYNQVEKVGADICTCDVSLVSAKGKEIKKFENDSDRYIQSKDVLNYNYFVSNWMWDKLYKSNVFDNLRFDTALKTYEDSHLIFRLIYGKKITSVKKVLYYYVQHNASTVNKLGATYLSDRIKVKDEQIEFLRRLGYVDEYYMANVYLKTFVYYCALKFARSSDKFEYDVARLKKEIDLNYFQIKFLIGLFGSDRKISCLLFIYKVSPKLFKYLIRSWDFVNSRKSKLSN